MLETIFLIVGFVSLVLLLFTNRLVIFGLLSIISFFGYFMVVDSGTWLTFLLFLFGILLLIAEVFIPDFGLIGIIGVTLIGFGYFSNRADLWGSVMDLSLALIIAVITAYVLLKKGYRFLPGKNLVLGSALKGNRGYSTGNNYQEYLYEKGTALTTLRPSGKVEINGRTLDVVSDGKIIQEGSSVEVVHVEGIKIIVREL
ncbi:NfeD family protein [Jeotgalibaca sp. A122]|uniref:NfeD family protein n=1 Tax=Jeotgalibaca sp. A122 TaxID=3457322 RepID=UPI003FD23E75